MKIINGISGFMNGPDGTSDDSQSSGSGWVYESSGDEEGALQRESEADTPSESYMQQVQAQEREQEQVGQQEENKQHDKPLTIVGMQMITPIMMAMQMMTVTETNSTDEAKTAENDHARDSEDEEGGKHGNQTEAVDQDEVDEDEDDDKDEDDLQELAKAPMQPKQRMVERSASSFGNLYIDVRAPPHNISNADPLSLSRTVDPTRLWASASQIKLNQGRLSRFSALLNNSENPMHEENEDAPPAWMANSKSAEAGGGASAALTDDLSAEEASELELSSAKSIESEDEGFLKISPPSPLADLDLII
jgi:hypothetical protein